MPLQLIILMLLPAITALLYNTCSKLVRLLTRLTLAWSVALYGWESCFWLHVVFFKFSWWKIFIVSYFYFFALLFFALLRVDRASIKCVCWVSIRCIIYSPISLFHLNLFYNLILLSLSVENKIIEKKFYIL